MIGLHVGRSWNGHPLEDQCPCVKAACGLVAEVNDMCGQHGVMASKTMRQIHHARDCEAVTAHAHNKP